MLPSVAPKHVTSILETVAFNTAGSFIIKFAFRIITQPVLAASLI